MQKNPHGYRSHHDKSHRGVERSPKMKYMGMPVALWAVFTRSFRKTLESGVGLTANEAREVTCGHYAQQRLVDFGEGSSVVGEKGRFSDAEVRIENRHHRLEVLAKSESTVQEDHPRTAGV